LGPGFWNRIRARVTTFTNHQQFHQYQQNEQPPLPHTIEHTKTTMHSLGNPVLGHAQTCGRVLRLGSGSKNPGPNSYFLYYIFIKALILIIFEHNA
jgi:hypothetical protein